MLGEKLLILGGTSFIGRAFCEHVLNRGMFQLTLFNRGLTNSHLFPEVPRIICDRSDRQQCRDLLDGSVWPHIVDFIGFEDHQIRNILDHCRCQHYTYISSSLVDLSYPDDPLFETAKNKLWCENLVKRYNDKCLIARPGFVCGKGDYTNRFENREGIWFWRNSNHPVQPMIQVEKLVSVLALLIARNQVGVVRAGYGAT
jgi:nucleoside-diphosphate-sugar epimerase